MLHKAVLILSIFIILPALFLRPSIAFMSEGTTIKTDQATFYIPAEKPLKVYKFDPAPKELEEIISKNIGNSETMFGIVIKNLSTGQEYSLNADEVFSSASLYKLSVMYTLYQKDSEGKLDISKDDIQRNLQSMITVSSNEASIYLVENYTSWQEITGDMRALGLSKTDLTKNPTESSAADMARLLELIAEGKAVNFDTSYSMLKLLSEQKVNDRIPVNLPDDTIVAHKTGELYDVRHDAGVVVTPDNNYILVLMSKDSSSPESVKPIMSKISEEVNNFFKNQWANPPEIL